MAFLIHHKEGISQADGNFLHEGWYGFSFLQSVDCYSAILFHSNIWSVEVAQGCYASEIASIAKISCMVEDLLRCGKYVALENLNRDMRAVEVLKHFEKWR